MTNHDPQDASYAEIDLEKYEYGRVTIEIYDSVFSSPDFESLATASVFHEMFHLFLHPLTAYCANMFAGDAGKLQELERLEELVVNILERKIPGLRQR